MGYELPGPDASRLPTLVEGQYLVLLRVEVSYDPDSGSNLALELEDNKAQQLLSAMPRRGVAIYRAPSWFKEKAGDGILRWRVMAFDQSGAVIGESQWRVLKLNSKQQVVSQ